jgi:hypothetical protein
VGQRNNCQSFSHWWQWFFTRTNFSLTKTNLILAKTIQDLDTSVPLLLHNFAISKYPKNRKMKILIS